MPTTSVRAVLSSVHVCLPGLDEGLHVVPGENVLFLEFLHDPPVGGRERLLLEFDEEDVLLLPWCVPVRGRS